MSLYAASASVSAVVGAFLGGVVVDHIGRKRLMLLACAPFVLGWAITALAAPPSAAHVGADGYTTISSPTFLLLFSGRLLLGFGGGMSAPGGAASVIQRHPHYGGASSTVGMQAADHAERILYIPHNGRPETSFSPKVVAHWAPGPYREPGLGSRSPRRHRCGAPSPRCSRSSRWRASESCTSSASSCTGAASP